ncbi:MAG TPA: DUF402 domain-containing protein [Bacillota bacterium]|nr:DUF402 domain-containing protein [Bacillota bacterium]
MVKKKEIVIQSLKHDGTFHRKWHENTILKQTKDEIIGINDATKVTDYDGTIWTSTEPAIFYFHAKKWFNVIAMLKDDGIHFYCNLSSPFTLRENVLSYIDYDLDVTVDPNGTVALLDEEEYERHKEIYNYSARIDQKIKEHVTLIYQLIRENQDPFTESFVKHWYNKAQS